MRLDLPHERSFLGPASLWKRLAAFIIDFIILDLVIFSPFRKVIVRLLPGDLAAIRAAVEGDTRLTTLLVVLIGVAGVLALLYFAILEHRFGATIGKRLLGIQVVAEGGLRFWQCLVRSLYFLPLSPLPLLWIIDPIHMLFTQDGSRLLERLSRTRTVERMVMR